MYTTVDFMYVCMFFFSIFTFIPLFFFHLLSWFLTFLFCRQNLAVDSYLCKYFSSKSVSGVHVVSFQDANTTAHKMESFLLVPGEVCTNIYCLGIQIIKSQTVHNLFLYCSVSNG